MPYNANKIDKGITDGQVYVQVVYFDDKSKFIESYRASSIQPDWPDAIIRSRLKQLNNVAKLDLSLIDLTTINPDPVIPDPTPDENAFTEFIAAYETYRILKRVIDSGIKSTSYSQSDVDEAFDIVNSLYNDSYKDFI